MEKDENGIQVNSIVVMEDGRIFSVCLLDVINKPRYKKELIKIAREVRELRNKIDSEK